MPTSRRRHRRHTSAKKQRTKQTEELAPKRKTSRSAGSTTVEHQEKFWTGNLRNFRNRMHGSPGKVRSFQIYLVREAAYTVWGNFSASPVEDDRDE